MTPAAVQLGDIVTINGVRARVRQVAGDRVWLVILDPVAKSLRDELAVPVRICDLDSPQSSSGSCFTTNSVAGEARKIDSE